MCVREMCVCLSVCQHAEGLLCMKRTEAVECRCEPPPTRIQDYRRQAEDATVQHPASNTEHNQGEPSDWHQKTPAMLKNMPAVDYSMSSVQSVRCV